jgi:hypothetical protein
LSYYLLPFHCKTEKELARQKRREEKTFLLSLLKSLQNHQLPIPQHFPLITSELEE